MADGFEGLEVWQKAHALMLFVHQRIAPCLPSEEKWDLAAQIRRSSKSIGANIAEGHGRFYFQDNVRFCYNARGSLAETIQHLMVARDLKYITSAMYDEGRALADQVYRLLNGYIAYLKQRKIGEHEPGANLIIHETRVAYEVGDWTDDANAFIDSPINQLPIDQLPVTD
jgi:four helix bundle protein